MSALVQSPPTETSRLRSIDALRGIAALGVVLYHAIERGKNALPNNLFDYPVRALQFISSYGYIGVFLFFVISGFCIHLFTNPAWLQSVNVLLLTVPVTILFAWVFFWFWERPFMVRRKKETTDRKSHWIPIVESQPSMVSD